MAALRERPGLLLTAWTCIFLAAALMIINEFLTMTRIWTQRLWVNGTLTGWYASKGRNWTRAAPVIMSSFFLKQIVFTWVPLLGIALLAIWTRNRPFRTRDGKAGSFDPTEIMSRRQSAWTRFKHQWTLVFTYQLPPRKLWNFFLDGGFNVIDFIVVALWVSLNVMWLYFSFYLTWPNMVKARKVKNGVTIYPYGSLSRDYCNALGYASAWAAVFNLVFVFIPISRSSFLQYLFNADFSSIIRYHRWLGHGTLLMSLFHGMIFYGVWLAESAAEFRSETFAWQRTGVNYLAGSISFFPFGLILWITTIPVIRRKFFKVFYACHIVGFFGYVLFLEIHYPSSIWYMPGLVLYFMDVAFRLAQWRVTSGMHCTFVSADRSFVTIKLKFNKTADVKTNQFLFLNCPKAGYFEWHPFSVAAAYPSQDGLTQDVIIHVKAFGSWSKKLVEVLAEDGEVSVRVDGPYGSSADPEWSHHDHIVMIAGGIGVTPLLGMLRDIQYAEKSAALADKKLGQHQSYAGIPTTVNLIWAVRHRDELQLLDQDLLATAAKSGSWLKLNLFHTKESDAYLADSGHVEQSVKASRHLAPYATSPNAVHRCALQPYGFGDFHWAICHVLAFVGAFFSCLMVTAYNFEGSVTGINKGRGMNIWNVAWLAFFALIAGSMGFPALIIFPAHYIRYRRHVAACKKAHESALSSGAKMHHNSLFDHPKVSEKQIQALMPSNMDQAGPFDVESAEGKAATVEFGRPNLKKIITEFVAQLPPTESVGVIASGPASLVVDARQATHKASRIASKAGLRGIPELSFSNHSFVL